MENNVIPLFRVSKGRALTLVGEDESARLRRALIRRMEKILRHVGIGVPVDVRFRQAVSGDLDYVLFDFPMCYMRDVAELIATIAHPHIGLVSGSSSRFRLNVQEIIDCDGRPVLHWHVVILNCSRVNQEREQWMRDV